MGDDVMRYAMFATIGALVLATPALAHDRTGYEAIAAGDFAKAERTLDAERRIFPERPELMLNLAQVYRATGRADQANALYRDVLVQPVVMLDLPNGLVVSSHDLANTGLARSAPRLAVR